MGVVSLCLSCQVASIDMQHDLHRSICDLDLRSCVSTRLAERITMMREFAASFLSSRVICKNVSKNSYFAVYGPLTPEPLTLAQI